MAFSSLLDIKGVGPAYYNRIKQILLQEEMPLERVYQLNAEELKQKFRLPINVARAIVNASKSENKQLDYLQTITHPQTLPSVTEPITEKHFKKIVRGDKGYPAKLERILGAKSPPTLYFWGNLDLLERPGIGFCGSRKVSDKGIDATRDISEQIAELNWVTVSGHARGVDNTAHLTALKNNAGTIIVLPEGINGFKLRTELREYAKHDNLLIISEFSPNAGWNVGYAMQRNATIIGLSDAMVLVEARNEGGTFAAGKMALSLHHPLFVVKFQDRDQSNSGNDFFIQSGAHKLMKKQETNRANIDYLVSVVKKEQTTPRTKSEIKQLAIEFDEK